MGSLDWICAALLVPENVPATAAGEEAAANLVDLLPDATWEQWPPEARSAVKFAVRYDTVALLNELQDAFDGANSRFSCRDTPEPDAQQWADLLAGRADRAEQAKHDEGLRNHATAIALAATALEALREHAILHPKGPADQRPDV